MHLDVFLTPCAVTDEALEGTLTVVIDVLRATTTITTALSAGAAAIRPVATMQEVEFQTASTDGNGYLRAGERDGEKIEGYDLGNSPLDYTSQTIEGQTIILTTTNGTRALSKASAAEEVIVGSMLNAYRVARWIAEREQDTVLLCAGRHNRPALEDTLCAGLLIDYLREIGASPEMTDAAHIVERFFDQTDDLETAVEASSSVQRLRQIGHERDISYCLQQDSLPILPRFVDGEITLR